MPMKSIIPTVSIVSTVRISMVLITPAGLCGIRFTTIRFTTIHGITEATTAITARGVQAGTAHITLSGTVGIAPTIPGDIHTTMGITTIGDTIITTMILTGMSTDIVAHRIAIMQVAEARDLLAAFQQAVVPG